MVVTLTTLNNAYKLPSYKNLTMIREGENVRHESMADALPEHAKHGIDKTTIKKSGQTRIKTVDRSTVELMEKRQLKLLNKPKCV